MARLKNLIPEITKLKIKYVMAWIIVSCCLYGLFLLLLVMGFYAFFPQPSLDSLVARLILAAGAIFFTYFVGLYCYGTYQKEKSLLQETAENKQ